MRRSFCANSKCKNCVLKDPLVRNNHLAIQPLSAALEEPHTRELLAYKLNTKDKLQMILRLGYVDDYGKNYKIRRDLHDYIKVESSQ